MSVVTVIDWLMNDLNIIFLNAAIRVVRLQIIRVEILKVA